MHSYASLKRQSKAQATAAANKLWLAVLPRSYHDLGISTAPRRPWELQLPRPVLGRLLASRTGHGDFADYHERFQHADAYLFCRCGGRKAPLHFLFCPIAKRKARRPPGHPSEVIPYLLGSVKGAQKLATWLAETEFYTDICPRHPPLTYKSDITHISFVFLFFLYLRNPDVGEGSRGRRRTHCRLAAKSTHATDLGHLL